MSYDELAKHYLYSNYLVVNGEACKDWLAKDILYLITIGSFMVIERQMLNAKTIISVSLKIYLNLQLMRILLLIHVNWK